MQVSHWLTDVISAERPFRARAQETLSLSLSVALTGMGCIRISGRPVFQDGSLELEDGSLEIGPPFLTLPSWQRNGESSKCGKSARKHMPMRRL
jgi:hypothetical protein